MKKSRPVNAVSRPVEAVFHMIMLFFCLCCVIPFVFVVIISFTSQQSIREIGFSFLPKEWSLEAYRYTFKMGQQLWRSYFNSFYITIVGTVLTLAVTIMYSYALFRKDFKFRRFFTFFCFFTMIFGGGLAPTYVVCKTVLGLSNSYAAVIVPMLLNPFNLIVMRTFFQSSVPMELIEAASIDGASPWQRFRHITMPMLMPAFTIVFFLTLSGSFKMLDENLALTSGNFGTRMLSLQILLSTRETTPANYGMAQAQAVIFFILIAVISIAQVIVTKRKEIEA